jgi:hypothetical protein
MKKLAIQKTIGTPPPDFNAWIKYIVKESRRLREVTR